MAPSPSSWDALPREIRGLIVARSSPLTRFLHGCNSDTSPASTRALWREALESNWSGDLHALPDPPDLRLSDVLESCSDSASKSRGFYDRLCSRLPLASESNPQFTTADALLMPAMHSAAISPSSQPSPLSFASSSSPPSSSSSASFPSKSPLDSFPKTKDASSSDNTRPVIATPTSAFGTASTSAVTQAFRILSREPARLLHIPMRRLWLDHPDLARSLADRPLARAIDAVVNNHPQLLAHIAENANTLSIDIASLPNIPMDPDEHAGSPLVAPMDRAAALGHMDVLAILHSAGVSCTIDAMDDAAANGHLNVLQFLHTNRSEGCSTAAIDEAAHNGHIHVVEFLLNHYPDIVTSSALCAAAISGNIDILQTLCAWNPSLITPVVLDQAAWGGHLDIVQYLSQSHPNLPHGACTINAINGAIRNRHYAIATWLAANRFEGFSAEALDHRSTPTHVIQSLLDSIDTVRHDALVREAQELRLFRALRRLQDNPVSQTVSV